MDEPTILLCGGTGQLGGAIARALSDEGRRYRALVRPGHDAGPLEALGAEIVRGDFRDPASLGPAMAGISTVVSTVNAIGRLLGGERDLSIRDVDERGYANAIVAAEAAGVLRFVYVSVLEAQLQVHSPFTDAKRATEERLRRSTVREVIVQADAFQEIWLGPVGGFDLAGGTVTIYGQGRSHHRFVAIDDLARAIALLAVADDPPRSVTLVGPEAMTPEEAVEAFERALGRPLRTRHIPRVAMRVGRVVARPFRPGLASIMGMALAGDTQETTVDESDFRALGIDPRPAHRYIDEVAAANR